MTLNPVEMLLVGAAFHVARMNPVDITTPVWKNPVGFAARHVVHAGAKKLGFRYTPGILKDPWFEEDEGNGFYEEQAALHLFTLHLLANPAKRTRTR